jgi:hypothetical protein
MTVAEWPRVAALVVLTTALPACSDPSGPQPEPPICPTPTAVPAAGGVLVGTASNPAWCAELPAHTSFLIAITNTSNDSAATRNLRVRTLQQAASAAAVMSPAVQPASSSVGADLRSTLPAVRHRHGRDHARILDANVRRLERASPLPGLAAMRATQQLPALQALPTVGDTLTFRVPRISEGVEKACELYDEVRARVAFVGTRSIIVEDVANPVVDVLDDYYRQIGEDFDNRQYSVVADNFADPLLLDEYLDNNGRVYMLFSRLVDASRIAGFVWSGDFYDRTDCPQSNVAEIFYGYVPSNPNPQYAANSAGEWFWSIRSTVVHEVKHIASFAQRISRFAARGEEMWLEEATAMAAEELWARQVFDYAANANVGYGSSVGCEIRGALGIAPCEGKPSALFQHFLLLAQWMQQPNQLTPLGRSHEGDGSFYGSGWLFLRWAIEHSGKPERDVLRDLTQTTARGTANLEARVGRPFADLITDWALAVLLDDRTGTTPANSRWSIRSWNVRDVFAGLNREQSSLMPTAFPLAVRTLSATAMTANSEIRAGGTAYFQVTTAAAPLGVDFLAVDGAAPSPLRVSVYRMH